MNALFYVDIDQGIHKVNISLSVNLLFLKSVLGVGNIRKRHKLYVGAHYCDFYSWSVPYISYIQGVPYGYIGVHLGLFLVTLLILKILQPLDGAANISSLKIY